MYCNQCGAAMPETAVRCSACARLIAPIEMKRRLVRPRDDRKIAGVCAAFARYFDLDVTVVRVVWLIALICAGTGLLAYLIAWIVIPEEPLALPARV